MTKYDLYFLVNMLLLLRGVLNIATRGAPLFIYIVLYSYSSSYNCFCPILSPLLFKSRVCLYVCKPKDIFFFFLITRHAQIFCRVKKKNKKK